MSRSGLLAACAAGSVVRPARGVFALPSGVDDTPVRAMAARGQLSCAHAALAHGLDVVSASDVVHVRIPRKSRRVMPPRRTVLHHWGWSGSEAVTSLETTLRDCAHCLDVPVAVGVLDSALRSGRITPEDLNRLAVGWSLAARAVARLTDPAAQSVLESVGRTVLSLAAVGEISSQVYVPRVGWVDLVIDDWLVIELDGYGTHKGSFQEDRRRDAELTRLGFVVLRFTYADLMSRREWFVGVVRETLDRGHPPFWFGPRADDFAARSEDTPLWRPT
ncbi:MAG: endonuclease domain-containing protein [Actinomycetota bacterium]|nr:endonuclease domain-containing protein [Actinomycetota bacterium]